MHLSSDFAFVVLIIIAWEIVKRILASFLTKKEGIQHSSVPLSPPTTVVNTSSSIEIGDVVIYRSSDDPQTIRQVMISRERSDPKNGCIVKDSPFGSQLLGLTENQTITCYVPGGERQVDIIAVKKAMENIKGPIGT